MTALSALLVLPPGLLENQVAQYLDAASLSKLSGSNRELQGQISRCPQWAVLVTRHFGLKAAAPIDRQTSWKDVFVAAWIDSHPLTSATQESDVLSVFGRRDSSVRLTPAQEQIRQEIVLMQGLRRFPTSDLLVRLYAQVIRSQALPLRLH